MTRRSGNVFFSGVSEYVLIRAEGSGKALEIMKPFADEKGVQITATYEKGVKVSGNSESLTEAFLNIIENGLKYNRQNGLLNVSEVSNGGKAIVTIRDTGVGIKSGVLPIRQIPDC